jgi:hypothetical protein
MQLKMQFGGSAYEEVQHTKVRCRVISNEIMCFGNRSSFVSRFDVPCVRYRGHYFVTALLFSVFLGLLGVDRFYLGHTGTAVGKLLTVGGLGVWWIVDIVLLVTGSLLPADGSNWIPYY